MNGQVQHCLQFRCSLCVWCSSRGYGLEVEALHQCCGRCATQPGYVGELLLHGLMLGALSCWEAPRAHLASM
jgi:hypothetical protein